MNTKHALKEGVLYGAIERPKDLATFVIPPAADL